MSGRSVCSNLQKSLSESPPELQFSFHLRFSCLGATVPQAARIQDSILRSLDRRTQNGLRAVHPPGDSDHRHWEKLFLRRVIQSLCSCQVSLVVGAPR